MPSQNKPLSEYGDLNSVHHIDRQKAEQEQKAAKEGEDTPARLVVREHVGNLYEVVWTHGDLPVPFECHGQWNHKGKATDAIKGAMARLQKEAEAELIARQKQAMEQKMEEEFVAEKVRLAEKAGGYEKYTEA